MHVTVPKPLILRTVAAALTALVLTIDILTPLGYIDWLFYIVPLLVAYLSESPAITYTFLLLTAVGLAVGFLSSPAAPVYEDMRVVSAANRIAGFAVLLVFTIIINRLIQARARYKQLSNKLEQTNRELESFTYSVSHDLRGPLNNIGLMKELLAGRYANALDDTGRKGLEQIGKNVTRMADIMSALLELSRVGRYELGMEEVALDGIAAGIVDELSKEEPSRRVEVHIDEGMIAYADRRLVTLVLENLIRNAWKYTADVARARIEIGARTEAGATVYFVKDNGAGFAMEDAERIFAPFQRAHSEQRYPGAGIGLSIVRRALERHGGEIWAESEVGRGACFYFRLA